MIGRGQRLRTARLLCAAAATGLWSAQLVAQISPAALPAPPDPAELDPNAPLAPMPDLGVAWPDLNAPDAVPPPAASTPGAVTPATSAPRPRAATDGSGEIRYSWTVEGLGSVAAVEDLLRTFKRQSALEA